MKTRIFIILISFSVIILNVTMHFPVMYGCFHFVFDTPDTSPPLKLSNNSFAQVATAICMILILVSMIWSSILIFRGKKLKSVLIPVLMSAVTLVLILASNNDYTLNSEARYPKGDFYYWQQLREYKTETRFYRWKKPLNVDNAKWELDSLSINSNLI